MGTFIAFRCSNFEHTAEREQFRSLCNMLKAKYAQTNDYCLLIANYNIYDSELDSILVKNDAIIAIELKNYGGHIVAVENGEWTADGTIIKGGSKKTVYQQARANHAALRNGLREVGIKEANIKDIPSIVVFNEDITIENKLSGKVKSWLHITDNSHFIEKVEDVTCQSTNLSNKDIVDLAIKLNLSNFIDNSLSYIPELDSKEEETKDPEPTKESIENYTRLTPNHIFQLRPNQIFVFGTDTKGSQKYGAAGIAAKCFNAQVGAIDGPTGNCYALPTRGFTIQDLAQAVSRFINYVQEHPTNTFLVTPVGCGHAGFNVNEVAALFKPLIDSENVMLPELFIDVYKNS